MVCLLLFSQLNHRWSDMMLTNRIGHHDANPFALGIPNMGVSCTAECVLGIVALDLERRLIMNLFLSMTA